MIESKYIKMEEIMQRSKDSGLYKAVNLENIAAMKSLLEGGANPNAEEHNGGWVLYPRHRAAAIGSLDACKMLYENGAVLNCLDYADRTPLDLANMYSNNPQLIDYLKAHGALSNAPDAKTPRMDG